MTRANCGNGIVCVKALLLVAILAFAAPSAWASDLVQPQHKIVVQISSGDPKSQTVALNNTANLVKELGMDNVQIEVVAYGPGLSILTDKSIAPDRVRSLEKVGVRFSACHNTMEAIQRETGKMPILLTDVKVVPAGVVRIVQLEEKGYSYIRP